MAGINYAVTSNWGSGFVADMTVPGGSQGLQGWTIEFDADFDISSIWGATIVSHVGDHYVISNANWNANVAAGNQAAFGFQATAGTGGTAVSGLTLDGAGITPPASPAAADPLDRRCERDRRQCRHDPALLHGHAITGRDRASDSALRDRRRDGERPAPTTPHRRARSPSPPVRRRRPSSCRSLATLPSRRMKP